MEASKSLPSALGPNEGALLPRVKIAQKLSLSLGKRILLQCGIVLKSVMKNILWRTEMKQSGDVIVHHNKESPHFLPWSKWIEMQKCAYFCDHDEMVFPEHLSSFWASQ